MLVGSIVLCLNACALDDENILGCRQASGILIEDAFFMGEFDEIKTTKDERVIITEGPFFSVVVGNSSCAIDSILTLTEAAPPK